MAKRIVYYIIITSFRLSANILVGFKRYQIHIFSMITVFWKKLLMLTLATAAASTHGRDNRHVNTIC